MKYLIVLYLSIFQTILLAEHDPDGESQSPIGPAEDCVVGTPVRGGGFSYVEVTKANKKIIVQGYTHAGSGDRRSVNQLINALRAGQGVNFNGEDLAADDALKTFIALPKVKPRVEKTAAMITQLEAKIERFGISTLYIEGPLLGQVNNRINAYRIHKRVLEADGSLTESEIKSILLEIHGPVVYLKVMYPALELKTVEDNKQILDSVVQAHVMRTRYRGVLQQIQAQDRTVSDLLSQIMDKDNDVKDGSLTAQRAETDLAIALAGLASKKINLGRGQEVKLSDFISDMFKLSEEFARLRAQRNNVISRNSANVKEGLIILGDSHFLPAFEGVKRSCK